MKKLQKLVSFCMIIFAIPTDIAHKMANKSNYILQKTFINFDKRQLKTDQTKTRKMTTKTLKTALFWAQKQLKMTF